MAALLTYRHEQSDRGYFSGFFEGMDRLFDGMVPSRLFGSAAPSYWSATGELMPVFDIVETDDNIVARADLSGIDARDLDLSLTGNLLSIGGERREERRGGGELFLRVKPRFGSFSRTPTLPADAKEEGIEATYQDGILTISIPKAGSALRKRF